MGIRRRRYPGFLGWLLGIVLRSNARPVPEPAARLDALDHRIAALEARLVPGDLLITMGAGDVVRLGEEYLKRG